MKANSILHEIKYFKGKKTYQFQLVKEKRIGAAIKAGYEIFKFDKGKKPAENFKALFFTAAMIDHTSLDRVLEYYIKTNFEALHKTIYGDTVLSFLVKYGNIEHEDFKNCFNLLLYKARVDFNRVDYSNNNILKIIRNEQKFLKEFETELPVREKMGILDSLIGIINQKDTESIYSSDEIKLFQSIITEHNLEGNFFQENQQSLNYDDGENSLLQLSIIMNKEKYVVHLLKHGANPNQITTNGNEYPPIILASLFKKEKVMDQLLKLGEISLTNETFGMIFHADPKYADKILAYQHLDPALVYNGNTPLYYAIRRSNQKAIQTLLTNGAELTESCLEMINPKDLNRYFTSCLKGDNYNSDIEDYRYRMFIVFDNFFTDSRDDSFSSEVSILVKLSRHKRLKHLLEHPLIQVFMLLKWQCIQFYYIVTTAFAFIFLSLFATCVYFDKQNTILAVVYAVTQAFNCTVTFVGNNMKRNPSLVLQNSDSTWTSIKSIFLYFNTHLIIEFLLLVCFIILSFMDILSEALIEQVISLIIVLMSISFLLTLGYHPKLSKWMAMIKKVFKSFILLLPLFMFPILAFSFSFHILLPQQNSTSESNPNEDFSSFSTSIFRTLIMLSGDIGDKQFVRFVSYILFLVFAVGMAIVLMNFWTGVAVSDIKEIEDQSVSAAISNVIIYVRNIELLYRKLYLNKLDTLFPNKMSEYLKRQRPFLNQKINLDQNKYKYGVNLYINRVKSFEKNPAVELETLRISEKLCNQIKLLKFSESNETNKMLEKLLKSTESTEKLLKEVVKKLKNNKN